MPSTANALIISHLALGRWGESLVRSRKEFTTLQGVVFGDLSLKVEREFLSVNEVYKQQFWTTFFTWPQQWSTISFCIKGKRNKRKQINILKNCLPGPSISQTKYLIKISQLLITFFLDFINLKPAWLLGNLNEEWKVFLSEYECYIYIIIWRCLR